jgi:hypothetical protein
MNKHEQEKHLLELRRSRVYELHAKGYSNTEISNMLSEHVSEPTVSRDLAVLRRQAKENIRNYIDQELPNEYHKTLVGLNAILKETWTAARNATGKDKIQALELAQKAYQMRLELLTNVTIVESAVKFVENIKKKKEEESRTKESIVTEQESESELSECQEIEQELELEQEQSEE